MNIEDKVLSIVSDELKVDKKKISKDLGVGDLAEWDSLAHTSLIVALEKNFNIMFDVEEVLDTETIRDMVEIITEKFDNDSQKTKF